MWLLEYNLYWNIEATYTELLCKRCFMLDWYLYFFQIGLEYIMEIYILFDTSSVHVLENVFAFNTIRIYINPKTFVPV